MKTYTLDQIMSAIDTHANKVIEQIHNQDTLNAVSAVDITSQSLQVAKVQQGLDNIKKSVTNILEEL